MDFIFNKIRAIKLKITDKSHHLQNLEHLIIDTIIMEINFL